MRVAAAFLSVVLALATSSVGLPAQQQSYATPYPRDGVLKLGENDRAVAWEIVRAKGLKSSVYELPLDQVAVTLTEGAVLYTLPGGLTRVIQDRFGSVRFESKGTVQQEEGLSDAPSRSIVFQLKDVPPPPKVRPVDGIPGQFPRINAVKLFETDRIVVWDQVWRENDIIPNHLHYAPTVTVFLVGGRLATRDYGGKSWNAPFERQQGDLLGFPPPGAKPAASSGATRMVPHEEAWVAGSPRAIWIEFKAQ